MRSIVSKASVMVAVFGVVSMLLTVAHGIGRSPSGPGYSAQPEPVPVSALPGEYPYRKGER